MHVRKAELLRKTVLGMSVAAGFAIAVAPAMGQTPAMGHSPSGQYVDPETGDIYRTVTHQITQPVVDERIERQEQVVYRPETIKETRPEVRTSYLPVTQMKWMPYVEGRWNPFRQPTVAYRQVPETHWESRSEVINRTTMQTRWVAEKRTVEIPHRTVRYETKQKTDLQLVARRMPTPQVGSNIDPKIAARLRPLNQPDSTTIASQPVTAIASNIVGRSTSEQPRRSSMQAGMRTNVLQPQGVLGTPAPSVGIATVPSFSTYR